MAVKVEPTTRMDVQPNPVSSLSVYVNQVATSSVAPATFVAVISTPIVCATPAASSSAPVISVRASTLSTSSTPLIYNPIMIPSPRAALMCPVLRAPYRVAVLNPRAQYRPAMQQNSGSLVNAGLPPAELAMYNLMMELERRSICLVCPFTEGYTYSREELIWAITNQGVPKSAIDSIGQMEKNCIW